MDEERSALQHPLQSLVNLAVQIHQILSCTLTLANFMQLCITLPSTSNFGHKLLKHPFWPAQKQLKSPGFVWSFCQMKAALLFFDLIFLY